MALAEPYPLAFLSNILPVADCTIEPVRFEEMSGAGSGQFWAAEMADPLWRVSATLSPCLWALAREINAKMNALGTTQSFHFSDPSYSPAAGDAPGSGVTISAIGATRQAIALAGLPAAYRITAGDRLSILRSGAGYYFGEFAETVTANSSGATAQVAISPALPLLVATGAAVSMANPVIRLRVPPGGFTPYREIPGGLSTGASFSLVQKR
ncbi:hypothetical protein [Paracoccus simplex]|uniref:Uncharacterized protein n=1 Tax=Paracoccus simplex TaxID=2086346 RepID=A0ABV7RYY8_9RHOB